MKESMMNALVPLIALGAALTVSGCSKSPEQPAAQPSSGSEAAVPVRPSVAPVVDSSEAATLPEAAPSEPTSDSGETVTADAIPAAIRGRWGLVPKDCTSQLGDAKGLLTVSAKQLKFYESVAKLGAIKETEPDRIRASFAYSGEGMTWTQDVVLAVQDGGKTLIHRDLGKDSQPGPLQYTRCS